jgi:hypothetical protein
MSAKDVLVWLFARKTRAGSKYLYGDNQGLMAQVALKAFRDYQSRQEADSRWKTDEITGRERKVGRSEWYDGDHKVSVIDGYSHDYDCYVTDIIIAPRNLRGNQHVIIDGDGNVLLNEWHDK